MESQEQPLGTIGPHQEIRYLAERTSPKNNALAEKANFLSQQAREQFRSNQEKILSQIQVEPFDKLMGSFMPEDETGSSQDDQKIPQLLKTIAVNQNGTVRSVVRDREQYFIAETPAQEGRSPCTMVLSTIRRDQYQPEKIIYHNPATDLGYDLVELYRLSGYSISLLTTKEGAAGITVHSSKQTEIVISPNAKKFLSDLGIIIAHESGHTFQTPLPMDTRNIFIDFPLSLLALGLPLKGIRDKIIDKISRYPKYLNLIYTNLEERNADSFAVAIYRKLHSQGVNIIDQNFLKDQLEYRKTAGGRLHPVYTA